MWIATDNEKRELEAYRALGSIEEIKKRLSSPYPQAEEGYAPRPRVWPDLPDGQYSGLLEED